MLGSRIWDDSRRRKHR
ncbi:hypothetical protein IEO21_00444 [Rhodonia placenta]|uniref:Uncharacterized protein n=1 Tax=Rhodonia placenta TaxID=104341 RepID=A0A8H7U647_9APHY|nr:hypothetical protein IEO21_00444 [Postia placenta]